MHQKGKTVSGSEWLQREFMREQVKECVAQLENRKAAGADQIVDEFINYSGEGTLTMMDMLFNWMWGNEYAPRRWREGVVVNLVEKGDMAEPGHHRGKTLISTVGKTLCKILNDRMGTVMEKEEKISEGQAGFRPNRSSIYHVHTLRKMIQGRKDRANNVLFLFGCTEGRWQRMEKWVVGKVVEN